MLDKRKKRWIQYIKFAHGLAQHPTSWQCMVRQQEKPGLVTDMYKYGRLRLWQGWGRHSKFSKQVCATVLTIVDALEKQCSPPYGEEPLRLFFLPSLTRKCFHIQIKCHLHNNASYSLGKPAVSSLYLTSVYPSLYHSADHTTLQQFDYKSAACFTKLQAPRKKGLCLICPQYLAQEVLNGFLDE